MQMLRQRTAFHTPSMQRNLFLALQKILTRNGSLKSPIADFFADKAKARGNTSVFQVILT